MTGLLKRFAAAEEAATAIEYGLIAALIATIAIVGMTTLGGGLQGLFGSVSNKSANAMSGG
jgi:pilus assembly protein Flp/PilA